MDNEVLFHVLSLVPVFLIAIGALVGFFRFGNIDRNQRLLLLLMVVAIIVELVSRYRWSQRLNTFPVFHVYAIVEYLILARIYSNSFKDILLGSLIRKSMIFMIVYTLLNAFFWQPLTTPNTNVTTVNSIVFVGLALFWFFRILNELRYQYIERSSFFWINIGVLTYFSGSLVIFSFADWLDDIEFSDSVSVWIIHLILNIIHYLCFNIALWMKPE